MLRALYAPGPSYHDPRVKEVAGWHKILVYQREAMELAGYEVDTPEAPAALLADRPSFARITSYGVAVAAMTQGKSYDLVLGAPSYGYIPMLAHPEARKISYGWNNAPAYRNRMLEPEYAKHGQTYDHSPVGDLLYVSGLRISDRVIACSPFVAVTHAEELLVSPDQDVHIPIAPWGVDSETFRPGEKNQRFTVLFVGGDSVRKGLDYALQAVYQLVANENLDLDFWVVGCPGESPIPNRVKVFGMVPHAQMPEIMARCHVLVLPSLEDGIALVVQEAMACGVVPIATPDPAEVFSHPLFVDEPCGYKVAYRRSDQIADKLRMLYEDRRLLKLEGEKARAAAELQTWAKFKECFATAIGLPA